MTKATSIAVSIIDETAKALKVQAADGRSGWIQRRWLRADGTVSADTFLKAAASTEQVRQASIARAEFKDGLHSFAAARETERAVAVQVEIDYIDVERDGRSLVWFPKSQVTNGCLPGWLINAKKRELMDTLRGRGNVALKCAGLPALAY